MTTLNAVNKHIQTKYPLIFLVKGDGYHWVHSDDDNIALQLSGLYTTSIDTPRITLLTPDEWLHKVEFVLADSSRYEFDRMPVKFKPTLAEQFKTEKQDHYRFDLEAFKRGFGLNPWERRKGKTLYCQYQVTFIDGSRISCIMTDRQRDSIHRSKIYNNIKCIGGEGHRELLGKNLN